MKSLLWPPFNLLVFSVLLPVATKAQPTLKHDIEELMVVGDSASTFNAFLSDSIQKTDIIDARCIENNHAIHLTDAVQFSPGVSVKNECSMCGIKRLQLNGLRGEHSAVLVDGMPSMTLISSFYAIDAMPTEGLDHIEIARGSGSSLSVPEAIGGTVNLISLMPENNQLSVDMSGGTLGFKQLAGFTSAVNADKTTGATLVAQIDQRSQFDEDHNGVSESPAVSNQVLVARFAHQLTDHSTLTLRYAHLVSDIFGGPVIGDRYADGKLHSSSQMLSRFDPVNKTPTSKRFVEGDVRNQFIGNAWEISEWINTKREEVSVTYQGIANEQWVWFAGSSYAKHTQDSFYEGFDYLANDEMGFVTSYLEKRWGDEMSLRLGFDAKHEFLHSYSTAGSASADYVADNFEYDDLGLYVQAHISHLDWLEVSFALRADHITAGFTAIDSQNKAIDETLLSPRVDLLWSHSESLTSRLSAGKGYRAPLSFFETDHGLLDGDHGFLVDVHALEKSYSLLYSLAIEGQYWQLLPSIAYTEVKNLSMLDETDEGVPVLTQLSDTATVVAADIQGRWKVADNLDLTASYEQFFYNDVFKSAFAIAPVEKRASFDLDWQVDRWSLYSRFVWLGGVELDDYDYQGYNRVNDSGDVDPSSVKTKHAPDFFLWNAKIKKSLSRHAVIYAGVNNLLDTTQSRKKDTPLMYNPEGQLDVTYIFGPLRGREIYAGLKLSW